MSSLHNDLVTWAAKAHLSGKHTIELQVRTAQDIAVQMVEMGQRIAELEHQLRDERARCVKIAETFAQSATDNITSGHLASTDGIGWQRQVGRRTCALDIAAAIESAGEP